MKRNCANCKFSIYKLITVVGAVLFEKDTYVYICIHPKIVFKSPLEVNRIISKDCALAENACIDWREKNE